MEKENTMQLELFSQDPDSLKMKSHLQEHAFLTRIRSYEKTIFIVMGIIVTGIASFSLGVEKGKRISVAKNTVIQQAQPQAEQKPAPANTKESVSTAPAASQSLKEMIQGYTIQLASYKSRTHAQQEAERLKKKGLSPSIMSKGSYIVLYVGNFSNKETAKALLSELRKRYSDCRIVRRL